MKMRVVWTQPASSQLAELHGYLSESSFEAADAQVAIVLNVVATLADIPEMGRPGRRRGTRELVVPGIPYIVAYRIRLGVVEILAMIHGARRWPRTFTL